MPAFPSQPSDLTAAWLTAALRASRAVSRARVTSFEVQPLSPEKGMTGTLAVLVLRYDVAEPDAPLTLVAKFSSDHPQLRAVVHSMGFFEREVQFYRELAGSVPVRTPRCYFADVDPVDGWSLLLLEDLTHERCGSWAGGSSLAEVQVALSSIAAVHARWWENPILPTKAWLSLAGLTSVPQMQQIAIDSWPGFLDRLSVPVTTAIADAGELVGRHLTETAAYLLESSPSTLIHHDFDADNLIFSWVDGRLSVTVLDWQLVTRGHAAVDVAWLVAGQCDPATRREHERDLVTGYHRLLVQHGVPDYPFEQCWDDYRLAMLMAAARVCTSVGALPGPRGGFWDAVFPRYAQALADLQVADLLEARHAALA
jgi:aminoglycoside/choline kinase family phosphotransferase